LTREGEIIKLPPPLVTGSQGVQRFDSRVVVKTRTNQRTIFVARKSAATVQEPQRILSKDNGHY